MAEVVPAAESGSTGSSTLATTRKFRDALTGRKRLVHLTPVLWGELAAFGNMAPMRRLHQGGLIPTETLAVHLEQLGIPDPW